MLLRRVAFPDFCEPCLPSPADKPPAGAGWLHEIKHDGFRMLVRRDGAGVRLFTRNGHDWTGRFPLIARAALSLKAASCLIDGEAAACDGDGLPVFDRLRYRRDDQRVFLYAFDLIELDGEDLRHEPIERRKAVLAKLLRPLTALDQEQESGSTGGQARGGGGLDKMTRGPKREIIRLSNERDFPHLVELALPPEGFRSVLLEIDAFHRDRRIPVRRGQNRHEVKQVYIRFCFPDAAIADAFRNRFGGECLTYAATSSDAPAVKRIDHNQPKRRVRAIQYGRR